MAGLIQVVIGVLTFLFPSLKELAVNIMAQNTGQDIFFKDGGYAVGHTFRYFGFASTLLDTFGYSIGIMFAITLFLSYYKNTYFLLLSPFFLLLTLLNSRTGIIVALIGILFYLIIVMSDYNKVKVKNTAILLFFSILILGICVILINLISPTTTIWISRGMENLANFILGRKSSNFEVTDVLFSDSFWSLPEDNKLLFGAGHSLYGMKDILGISSDVGYVNHIWIGGFILLILIVLIHTYLVLKVYLKNKSILTLNLMLFLLFSFFIVLIKADIVGYNPGVIIVYLIVGYSIYETIGNNGGKNEQ